MQAALLADAAVSALVGGRVYVGRGAQGGLSRASVGAFSGDGDLLTSIVVRLGGRIARAAGRGRHEFGAGLPIVAANQIIECWVYAQDDYDDIQAVVRAIRRVLHGNAALRAVDDPISWAETTWIDDGPEQIDTSFQPPLPMVLTRYEAVITERLEAP